MPSNNIEVVRFWLNNWTCGETYPNEEPFISWFKNDSDIKLTDEDWVKENKLCVRVGLVDMSLVFNITAPKEWVDKNCPNIYDYPKFFAEEVWSEDQECVDYYDIYGYEFLEYSELKMKISNGMAPHLVQITVESS